MMLELQIGDSRWPRYQTREKTEANEQLALAA
jgi:hypothetical protein